MFGSVVIDVAIGMAFVYLLMSLIASVVQEILAAFLQLRPANLARGMFSLFSGDSIWGQDLVDAIYNHGLVRGLYADPGRDLAQPMKAAQATFAAAQAGLQAAQAAGINPETARARINEATQVMAKAKDELSTMKTKMQGSVISRVVAPLRSWMLKIVGFKPEKSVSGVSDQAQLPSYIPSRTFALALIDILNHNKLTGNDAMNAITKSLSDHNWTYRANKAGEALLALAVDAKGDLATFQKNLESWYNDSMDRVSGWYKKYIQRILLFLGMALAAVFNVNSIRVSQTLWLDRDSRQAMVNAADDYMKTHPDRPQAPAPPQSGSASGDANNTAASDGQSSAADLQKKLQLSVDAFKNVTNTALLPVGWKQTPSEYLKSTPRVSDVGLHCLVVLVGWMITAIAISLGAPFWFDTLNKFMVVRSTVKPQEKSQPEGSKS